MTPICPLCETCEHQDKAPPLATMLRSIGDPETALKATREHRNDIKEALNGNDGFNLETILQHGRVEAVTHANGEAMHNLRNPVFMRRIQLETIHDLGCTMCAKKREKEAKAAEAAAEAIAGVVVPTVSDTIAA